MLDGYLTVDTGAWHFHLCVNDHRGRARANWRACGGWRARRSSSTDGGHAARPDHGACGSGTGVASRWSRSCSPAPHYDEWRIPRAPLRPPELRSAHRPVREDVPAARYGAG